MVIKENPGKQMTLAHESFLIFPTKRLLLGAGSHVTKVTREASAQATCAVRALLLIDGHRV